MARVNARATDARADGSVQNPGLSIVHLRRLDPSDSGASAHSSAGTSLSSHAEYAKHAGIPVAHYIGKKNGKSIFKYLDANHEEISKAEAMEKAGGVVYYQKEDRLRHRGPWISVDEARTLVSGSRGSNCSDIAPLHELLVFEEPDGMLEPQFGKSILVRLLWLMVLALLAFTAWTACAHLRFWPDGIDSNTELLEGSMGLGPAGISSNIKFLQKLDPELSQLLANSDITLCARGDVRCKRGSSKTIIDRADSMGLSKSLTELLAKEEMGVGEDEAELAQFFLDGPHQTTGDKLSKQKALAMAEVERILNSHKVGEILGGGSRTQQRQTFSGIVRLLHPDKGLVSASDPRAALALRLTFAARKVSMG